MLAVAYEPAVSSSTVTQRKSARDKTLEAETPSRRERNAI